MNPKSTFCIASLAAVLLTSAASAQTLVNFDSPDIIALTDVTTQYIADGVTFSGVTDSGAVVNIEAADTNLFSDVNPFSPPNVLSDYYDDDKFNRARLMVINFSGSASGISFEYNPAGPKGSNTVFEVYDPSGNLVDSFSDTNATRVGVWYFESIPDTNVGQVVIVAPQSGWGHYIDNLVFTLAPLVGSLQVAITPNGAAPAGAEWHLRGGALESSEATVTNLPGGAYPVFFTSISGWSTPPSQILTVTNGATTMAAGLYIPTTTPPNGLILLINGYGTIQHGTWPAALVNGKKYTVTAKPAADNLFAGWVGGTGQPYSLVSSSPAYTFKMEPNLVLEANFVTNIFLAAQGTYNGLFAPATTPRQQTNSGSFTLYVTSSGGFSGKLLIGAQVINLKGAFDVNGAAQFSPSGHPSWTITLQLDLAGQSVHGTVSDGSFVAALRGDQGVFSPTYEAAAYQGQYTLIIPGVTNASHGPFGASYGTVTVNASGGITFGGSLADATSVSQSSVVSKNGSWPFYLSLYGGKGSLWSWNSFTNGAIISVVFASWINPTNSTAGALYSTGFTNQYASILGSFYNPTNRPLLALSNGDVSLDIVTNPPVLVNFDAAGINALTPVTTQYVAGGVTFRGMTASGKKVDILAATDALYGDINAYSPPNVLSDFYDDSTTNRAKLMEINFTHSVHGVSFEYNPAGSEGSNTVFKVYSPSGVLVDSFSDPSATNDGEWYLESIPGADVGQVVIVAPVPGWGHYIDNLQFTLNGIFSFALDNEVSLSSNNMISLTSAAENTNKLALTINKNTGVVSGTFANPSSPNQTIKVNGVLLQNETNAQGYFAGTSRSGSFKLEPPQAAEAPDVAAKASVAASPPKGSITNPAQVQQTRADGAASPRNQGQTNP
jgi:hypothetical protein